MLRPTGDAFGVELARDAKLACSYYLQVASDPPTAVCMVPGSARPVTAFNSTNLLNS